MVISKPTHGSTDARTWGSDVIDMVNGLGVFNARATYGAAGNGSTDDTTAIQNAINAANTAGGGLVYLPAGVYMISTGLVMKNNVYLLGDGMNVTVLKKTANIPLLKFWGSAAGDANHIKWAGAAGMTLDGDDHTGTCIDVAYANLLQFRDIHCQHNLDYTLDFVEAYEVRFYGCSTDNCGSTTAEVVRLGASRTASGFGFTTESTNQIQFFGFRVETWIKGAILIDPGPSGNVYQIYFFGLKVETFQVRGPAIKVIPGVWDVHIDDAFIHMGDFASGFSTAQNAIDLGGWGTCTIRGVQISNGGVATISNGVAISADNSNIDAIHGSYTTAPTGAHILAGTNLGVRIGHCTTTLGTAFSGQVVNFLIDAATIATEATYGDRFRVTLGGNRTLGNPTNPRDGQTITWEIIQDGTGNRTLALGSAFALGTTITSTTLTTTASKRDFLTATYNSTAAKWYVTQFVKGY